MAQSFVNALKNLHSIADSVAMVDKYDGPVACMNKIGDFEWVGGDNCLSEAQLKQKFSQDLNEA